MAGIDEIYPKDMGLQATVMAIREEMMNYFKGTCVDRVTANRNVRLTRLPSDRLPYQYQRLELERKRITGLYVADTLLFTLQLEPDRVLFGKELDRSPQLREVKKAVDKFMERYLAGVNRDYYDGTPPQEVDDSELLTTRPRIRGSGTVYGVDQFAMYEEAMREYPRMRYTFTGFNTATTTDMTSDGAQFYNLAAQPAVELTDDTPF